MKPWTLAIVVSLLFAGAARADMSWDLRTETTVSVGPEQPTRFINTSNDAVLFVSYQTETFLLTDFNDLAGVQSNERAALRAKLPLMELGLAQLPPEQRPEQQALLQGQRRKFEIWDRPYTVRATTERAVVLDHPCVKYEGLAGEEVFQEIWVAEDIAVDPYYQAQAVGKLSSLDAQQYQVLTRVRGLPLKVVSHYGPVTVTATVTRYTAADIPADAFILPDDFRETEAASKVNP